jgi:hypothetical protein
MFQTCESERDCHAGFSARDVVADKIKRTLPGNHPGSVHDPRAS